MPMLLGLLLMIAGLVFQHDNVAICGGLFFGLSSTIMVAQLIWPSYIFTACQGLFRTKVFFSVAP